MALTEVNHRNERKVRQNANKNRQKYNHADTLVKFEVSNRVDKQVYKGVW